MLLITNDFTSCVKTYKAAKLQESLTAKWIKEEVINTE